MGETSVLQNLMQPSQQKLFDLLGTHCLPPSPDFLKFIHPIWSTSCGTMGGVPPSHITLRCLILIMMT
jgi:hypothetical protein